MARIRWIDEGEASGELAGLYQRIKESSPRGNVADIMKTMSLRPDFLAAIHKASAMHFTDGHLTRAQHEMIAAYVSAVNRCHY
jgi:alkylhydroperoxidase family enzyme